MEEPSDSTNLLHRFLGGTLYTSVGTGLRILSGIIATKILATYLPRTEFGTVILIELVADFLRMVSGLSIGVAAIRVLTDADQEEQKIIVDTVVLFRLMTVVIVALIFLVVQPWVYKLFGKEPVDDLAIPILLFTLVLAYQVVLKQMLQGFFRFKQIAFIELGASVLNLALLFLFLVWLDVGMLGAIWARILTAGVVCLLFYLYLPTRKGLAFRLGTLRAMLHFSWPLQVNEILTFVFRSFGTLVVATIMTPADVALLSVANKIPTNIRRLYESFRTVYFPNLASLITRGDYRRAQKMLNVTLRGVAFLMAFATVLVLIFQREIILLLYSDQYLGIGTLLVLSMLSTTIGLVGNVLGNSTVAAGNSKAPPVSNTVNTIVTIVSNLVLVPVWGILGAAWASILGGTATNPLNVWFLRRTGLIPRVMDYVKPLALFGLLYGLFWWLQPEELYIRVLFLPAFLVASFVLKIVPLEDIRMLWDGLERLLGGRLRKLAVWRS